jgi:High-affinity nickel-transport protein
VGITGLSVAFCFFTGAIEVLGLLPQEIPGLSQTESFWGSMDNFDINKAGFVIVGMFIITWAVALLIWRYSHIEEKRSARLQGVSPGAQAEAVELMMAGEEAPDENRGHTALAAAGPAHRSKAARTLVPLVRARSRIRA